MTHENSCCMGLDPGNETNSTLPVSRRTCQALLAASVCLRPLWGQAPRLSRLGEARRSIDAFIENESAAEPSILRFLRSNLFDHNRRGPATRVHLAAGRNALSSEG